MFLQKMFMYCNGPVIYYKLLLNLGIRSQSKPHDIMSEVYRAMKALSFVSFIYTHTLLP